MIEMKMIKMKLKKKSKKRLNMSQPEKLVRKQLPRER